MGAANNFFMIIDDDHFPNLLIEMKGIGIGH